jgi:hypothetical protein
VWRLLRQLVRSMRQAIIPQPCFDNLLAATTELRRHLHEPPRKKREYQKMHRIF